MIVRAVEGAGAVDGGEFHDAGCGRNVVQELGDQVPEMIDVEGIGALGDDRRDITGFRLRRHDSDRFGRHMGIEHQRIAAADIDGEHAVVEIAVAPAIHVLEAERELTAIHVHRADGMGDAVGIEIVAEPVRARGSMIFAPHKPPRRTAGSDIPERGIDAVEGRGRAVRIAEFEMAL